jgi:hypothetical protein
MRFVLDNSVVMRWLFGDGLAEDLDYANRILEVLRQEGSVVAVPSIWPLAYLELALREGLPLATNDRNLRQALAKAGGTLA